MKLAVIVVSQDRSEVLLKVHAALVCENTVGLCGARIITVQRGKVKGLTVGKMIFADHLPDTWQIGAMKQIGAREAIKEGAEYLIFLDGDCVPQEGWLAEYKVQFGLFSFIFGRINREEKDGSIKEDYRSFLYCNQFLEQGGGGNMGISVRAFQAVDGFDPVFDGGWGYEDADLVQRVIAKGYNWNYADKAIVVHKYHERNHDHFEGLARNRAIYRKRYAA